MLCSHVSFLLFIITLKQCANFFLLFLVLFKKIMYDWSQTFGGTKICLFVKNEKKKSPQCFEDISDYEGIQLKFMQSNQCLQELQLGKR